MGKVVLLILLVVVAFLVLKGLKRAGTARGRPGAAPSRKASERMLTCAWCGVNLPESEGVRADEKFFCSEDHRRLGS